VLLEEIKHLHAREQLQVFLSLIALYIYFMIRRWAEQEFFFKFKYICWIPELFAFTGVNAKANDLPDVVFCYLHTRTGIRTRESKQTAMFL